MVIFRFSVPSRCVVGRLVALILAVALVAGCNLQNPPPVAEPTWEEQREAILDITPVGTPRDDVATRLANAGVQFTCSGEEPEYHPDLRCSMFYCHRWSLGDGKIWPLDVALLFDESGNLYKIRRSSADISQADFSNRTTTSPTATTAGAAREPAPGNSGPDLEPAEGVRNGPRTSFGAQRGSGP